jgi:uncharacterized protein (TIGR03067 family)
VQAIPRPGLTVDFYNAGSDQYQSWRHTMNAHFLTLLVPIALSLGTQDNAVDTEFGRLAGTWQVTGHETNGKPTNEEHWRKVQFVFNGNQLTFGGDDVLSKKVAKITLLVDPSTSPRVIDLKIVAGEFKGTTLEGVYEIKDDGLKICFRNDESKNRPNEFSTKQDANLVLFVLKRQKK